MCKEPSGKSQLTSQISLAILVDDMHAYKLSYCQFTAPTKKIISSIS